MDLEAIKRRIRALANMTQERGASEAEALNAAAAIAELLREHGLTAAEIEATAKSDAATPSQEQSQDLGRRAHDVVRCASAIAAYFDCKVWMSSRNGQKRVVFFGFPQDTAAASAMLALVRDAMEREWAAYWRTARAVSAVSGQTARTSFLAGMAWRVSERLRVMKAEQRRAEQQTASASGSTALVVVKDRAVAQAFTQLGFRLIAARGRSSGGDGYARAAGRAAGDRVNLGGARQSIGGAALRLK